MRILFIQPRISYYNGGGEKYPMESILKIATANKNYEIIVLTTRDTSLPSTSIYRDFKKKAKETSNLNLIELPVPDKFKYIYKIQAGESRARWDIESAYFSNLAMGYLQDNNLNPDIIWSYYILDFPHKFAGAQTVLNLLGYPRKASDYREALLAQYDHIVPINQNILDHWNDWLEFKITEFDFLPLGVTFTDNPVETTLVPTHSKKDLEILYVGRLIERKGVLDLCSTVVSLHREGISVGLTIVGDGPCKDAIVSLIAAESMEKIINLEGYQEDVIKYYRSADVCVFPSYAGEGQMSAVLEAMYYNGNVITTSGNGNEDYIDHGKNGFLVQQGDFEELGTLLEDYVEGKVGDTSRIANLAKKTVQGNTWERYNINFVNLCRKFCGNTPVETKD